MKKTISIRLAKTDNGEICFKYKDSDIARTPYGLTSLIRQGIDDETITKGTKIVDNDYTRYVFNCHIDQNQVDIIIRIRNEYLNEAYDILENLDALCLETKYIKSKNMVKILAVSLVGVVFLSIAGAKIADRIRDPEHYDFGRNGEYSNSNNLNNNNEEKNDIYNEVYNNIKK